MNTENTKANVTAQDNPELSKVLNELCVDIKNNPFFQMITQALSALNNGDIFKELSVDAANGTDGRWQLEYSYNEKLTGAEDKFEKVITEKLDYYTFKALLINEPVECTITFKFSDTTFVFKWDNDLKHFVGVKDDDINNERVYNEINKEFVLKNEYLKSLNNVPVKENENTVVPEMTNDEEYLLSEALLLLGQFDGLPNLDALEGLRLGLGVKRNERHIISFTKNPLENSNLLGELFTAASQKQVIEIHYHKFSDPEKELVVNLHPYLLKEYNRRWYLFAAAEDDEKMLCFGLDRIDKVVPLPSHKYIEYDGDLNERFEDIIGVTLFEDSPVYPIIFWVSDFSKDYVLTKPIHDSQKKVNESKVSSLREQYPSLDNGVFLQIDCRDNYELIRELASFGKDLIVLSPSVIQDKVWNRISSMNEEYLKIRNSK